MNRTCIDALANQFESIYRGEPWLDETFAKKLGSLSETQAFARPLPMLHSVAEIISHLLVWRNEVIHRLQGNPAQLSVNHPANWKDSEELKTEGWEILQQQFDDSQERLLTLLRENDDSFLEQEYKQSTATDPYRYYLEGLLHHDCYHPGQVGLIIKMLSE